MELTGQNQFPHVINILGGVLVVAILDRGNSSQMLDIAQHEFGLAVIKLVIGLRSVRSTMKLKI